MNIKQRIVLFIGALIFAALGFFPPWHSAGSSVREVEIRETAGYGEHESVAVAAAAAPEAFNHSLGFSFIFRPPNAGSSAIDLSRLAVEWLSLIALTGSLIVVLSKRKSNTE